MNQEYNDRVEVLCTGQFKGSYNKDGFEIDYHNRTFKVLDETYIFSNTQLRVLEAIIRCYPNPALWGGLEFFVYGDREIKDTKKNISIHLYRIRKEMLESKFILDTVWGTGIVIRRKRDEEIQKSDSCSCGSSVTSPK
jgi:hypothetical protein